MHTDTPASGERSVRWRSAILFGLPAVVLVLAALFVAVFEKKAPLSEGGITVISTARVATASPAEHQGELVALPYHWDSHHRGERGSAVFTATFELAQMPLEPWALQFPKIGNAYEVSLNGVPLERRGTLGEHDRADSALLPRYVPLGAHLRPGVNRLTIAIRADRGRDAGLSKILVGPAQRIRDDLEHRYNWLVGSATAVTALSVGVGLLSLGIWRSKARRPDDAPSRDRYLYLYAGLAELTGAAVAGTGLVGSPPLPWPWWGVIWNTALGSSIVFITLFCVEAAQWGSSSHATRLRRWLVALVLAGPAATYAALGLGAVWALGSWYAMLATTLAGFAGVFLVRAIRGATLEHQLVSIAIVANLAAGVYDFYAFQSASDYLHITMLVYSSILFDLTLGAIVILRMRAANEQVGELMRSLSDRVADRERELGESYRRLELLAREQARMSERASILRDMHDGVGAHLSMALRQIESGRLTKEELVPPVRDALDQLKLTIDNVSLPAGDVVSLMGNLRYRLGPRIESSGIQLRWQVDPVAPVARLDGQAMRHLMFILFEAISNALQHSGANELSVEAVETEAGVELRVIDNGAGFDVASSWETGLQTMRNRAERIGARLEIRSAPGETRVELVIPREG